MNSSQDIPSHNWITLYRSMMEPPEPMLRVMESLDYLEKGEGIQMLHRMKPRLLFPKLQERGYEFQVLEHAPDQVEVRIWLESK